MYTVIENHEHFLLINKHPGISFHKDDKEEGLVSVLKSDLGIRELYTVHRLDTITSGLLLFAKNRGTAKDLSSQFRRRRIDKYYLAISDRKPKKKQGLIKGDMEKARRGAWKLSRSKNNPAVTRFFSYSLGSGMRLFLLRPYTGKTHQLRVALKSIGSPVLGDEAYYKGEPDKPLPDRGYLHSYAIRFHIREKEYKFICKPDIGSFFTDKPFAHAIHQCRTPWKLNWPETK